MSGPGVALLVGLFGVPTVLLWLGHRLRDRTAAQRGAFWGGVGGHLLGVAVTLLAAMSPPVGWAAEGAGRAAVVHWSLLAGGLVGIVVGAAFARHRRSRSARR